MTSAERFERAWHAVGAGEGAQRALQRLQAAYAQPHRHYHTLEHIEACLAWLDWTWASAQRPHEILLALWYHDAVYDPLASDNEAQSVTLMRSDLRAADAALDAIERVAALIMATREHSASASSPDAALLVDIDLSILGAAPETFQRFERAIRAEYAAIEPRLYANGRAGVLKRLAARSPLYATELINSELSAQAMRNLQGAVERWEREALG